MGARSAGGGGGGGLSGVRLGMGRSIGAEDGLSVQRKNRSWSAQQKIEVVLAGLCGDQQAAAAHGIQKGELTLGTDNGPAFTARRY